MGLWLLQIHYSLDNEKRLPATNHDKHVSDCFMVSFRARLLVLWEKVENLDTQLQGSSNVRQRRGEACNRFLVVKNLVRYTASKDVHE